ncbi:hypothetical protein EMCRGX_G017401 [Ephydatia muelleri]
MRWIEKEVKSGERTAKVTHVGRSLGEGLPRLKKPASQSKGMKRASSKVLLVAAVTLSWVCAAIPVPFTPDSTVTTLNTNAPVGFHSELNAALALPANSTMQLGKLISLKQGVFGFQSSLNVLSGTFWVTRPGVYYLSTIIHISTNSSGQSCSIKAAICISDDCKLNASLQGTSHFTEARSTVSASGLLLLEIPQTVKVHIFNYGPGDVVVGAPSSFSAYLLWAV